MWRRALRAIDPLKTAKENIDQSELPNSPVTKIEKNDPGKDKKLDGEVRKGNLSIEYATKQLTDDGNRGDISPSQYKQRIIALTQSKAVKQMTDADANSEQEFAAIEKILKNAATEDKPYLEKVLVDKAKGRLNSKTNNGISDGQRLLELHNKYFR